ncbi:ATP synthase F0 subunit B [Streptomyces botrytidirepellens]|uniref:Cell division initiation protein n=1 Tax=Streptomyces botrytidirepellens TaxID=2486417 RepID=A0A3M8VSK8_9ACTN|nr:ATP synthase F0 subunit B [Streptomyces botrytidirepellens]RNG20758.1 cell division initiation protein [Streptomyces botrytidirepellens]
MDVQKKLDEIVSAVGSARAMPMSASCVVNRAELLAMLEEVRAALPDSLAHAEELIGGRDRMVDDARQEATRIIESAHAERAGLISETEVARTSQEEADRILAEARREAEEIRAEADDYVDSKLANFEVVLTKTIGSVDRGRDKLLGRAPGGDGMDDEPERSADPHTLRQRADEYVDTKLGAVSAVLSKTLEAVGRGRQKLLGSRPADELGVHMAAQDATAQALRTSDDDYYAELAQSQGAAAQPAAVPVQPPVVQPAAVQPAAMDPAAMDPAAMDPGAMNPAAMDPAVADAGYYAQQPGYPQQDAYGYQQQGYVQQPDPYAQQAGYPQADAYGGWQQQPQGYDPNGYAQQPPPQPPYPPQQPGAALDETSLFDTSMIDLDQLRQYEQGR